MGRKIKGMISLVASVDIWQCEEGESVGYYLSGCGAGGDDIVISEVEVEIEIPADMTLTVVNGKFVRAMKNRQEKIKAEASLKCDNIEESIQRILALPAPSGEK